MKHTHQSGRSMIEMLGVLVVIGVLSMGALAGYTQAITKYRSNKTFDDITYISDEISKLYSWQRKYPTTINYTTLCSNDVFPDACTDAAPLNAFRGNFCVTSNGSTLTISASDIPQNECTLLMNREWPYAIDVSCGSGAGACSSSSGNSTLTVIFE